MNVCLIFCEQIDDSSAPISLAQLIQTANLAEANAPEEEKVKAVMIQSCQQYDPINYVRTTLGPPPPSYTCFRCGKPGHYIKNCPTHGAIDNFRNGTGYTKRLRTQLQQQQQQQQQKPPPPTPLMSFVPPAAVVTAAEHSKASSGSMSSVLAEKGIQREAEEFAQLVADQAGNWAASIQSREAEYKERRLRELLGVRMWKASLRVKK
ncbi:hypothetical protein QYF61_013855 [Mycteria americana]|uniref:CCHC-type domain-containing protein n=1 Tax=Mycteria americana TaxID=33587 RepID=A0AAN7RKL0_MYCAM|nr:hypothetical protein QYF61_013855 [Mycteria americana]